MLAISAADREPSRMMTLAEIDRGAVLAGEDLDALGGGVGALVELAGQVLDGEGVFVGSECRVREVSSTCGSDRMWLTAASNSAAVRPSRS